MNSRQSHVILRPVINEKTVSLAAKSKYTFAVAVDSNKTEIRDAMRQILKELYPKNKCEVLGVNTSAVRGRFRQSKRHGRAPHDSKKAIITISGEPFDLFSA